VLDAFRLIPALQVIFAQEMEFTEDSFADLTIEQAEAFARRGEELTEPVYRVTTIEPHAIERSAEKVTMEVAIVTESERQALLDGVAFVYRASAEMNEQMPTFAQRLEYLRSRLPTIVTTKPDER
jgi:hypothetical protein